MPEDVEPPVDPDVGSPVDADAAVPDRRARGAWRGGEGPVLTVIAIGGVAGALARYAAGLAWPTAHGTFPWTTFVINLVGCALIGVLLVAVTEVWQTHRLVRPLLATGVLGGFTTFSTYAVDAHTLLTDGHPATALLYLAVTAVAALAAVTLATRVARVAFAGLHRQVQA